MSERPGGAGVAILGSDPPAWVQLLTRMASTTERTLEMVERLQVDQRALHRTLGELEQQFQAEPAVPISVEGTPHPVADGEFDAHRKHLLARLPAERELILAASGERGLRPALLLVVHGRALRAMLLGTLEESLLLRLWMERDRAERCGERGATIPAKVLAARMVLASPWGDGLRHRPAPGTVRSAFTRLRKKIQAFAGSSVLLVGGREGYRLTPTQVPGPAVPSEQG